MEYIITNDNIEQINDYINKNNKLIFYPGNYKFKIKKNCYLKITASGGKGGNGVSGSDCTFYDMYDEYLRKRQSNGYVTFYGGSGGYGGHGAICTGFISISKNDNLIFNVGNQGDDGNGQWHGSDSRDGYYGNDGKDGENTKILLEDKVIVDALPGIGGEGGKPAYSAWRDRHRSGAYSGNNGESYRFKTGSVNLLEQPKIENNKNSGNGSIIIEVLSVKSLKYLLKHENKYCSINENLYINNYIKPLEIENLNDKDFNKYGFNKISDINNKIKSINKKGIEKEIDKGQLFEIELENSYKSIEIE